MVPFDENRTAQELLEEVSKRVSQHWRFNKASDEYVQTGKNLNRLEYKESLLPLEHSLKDSGVIPDSQMLAYFDPTE